MTLLDACRAEIVRHHEVIAGWLTGDLPTSSFDDLAAAHTPDFTLVTPDGTVLTAAEVLTWMRSAHGTAPDLTITIHDVSLVAADGDLVVASYTETHPDRSRRSTVVFRRHPTTPGALLWTHLHETWPPLPSPQLVATPDSRGTTRRGRGSTSRPLADSAEVKNGAGPAEDLRSVPARPAGDPKTGQPPSFLKRFSLLRLDFQDPLDQQACLLVFSAHNEELHQVGRVRERSQKGLGHRLHQPLWIPGALEPGKHDLPDLPAERRKMGHPLLRPCQSHRVPKVDTAQVMTAGETHNIQGAIRADHRRGVVGDPPGTHGPLIHVQLGNRELHE